MVFSVAAKQKIDTVANISNPTAVQCRLKLFSE
jgi:hypothetical protein